MLRKRTCIAKLMMVSGVLLVSQPAAVYSAPPCSLLGIPVCCFCAWACTYSYTVTGTATGRDKEVEADADCCASCCPETPANPQQATCTVETKRKYTVTVTGGIEIDPVALGLEVGWEDETTIGTTCTANCTDCNKGHCEGGFNTKTTTYAYTERCHPFGGGGSATVTVTERTSAYCTSTTAGCGKVVGNGTDIAPGVTRNP